MSILRSSRFVRSVLSELRFGALSRLRSNNSLILKSSSIVSSSRFVSNYENRRNQPYTIEKAIERMDRDVRRVGRISVKELLEVFEDIKNTGRATSTQSLFLIRCCGNLVPEEPPESRSQLVSNVWGTLEKLGLPLDISHYNALLSVYIENEFDFKPLGFISNLEAKGVEPNRVTYQRLVTSCCLKGDIEGATQILQVMKDKQIPINESIFNSLIIGHSQANDMDSAVGILSVMKQAGIEPTSATYVALLCGHAKHGDIDSIDRTFEECKANEIDINDRDILEVVYSLVANGHLKHLDRVFARLYAKADIREDLKNLCSRLISRGNATGVIEVLKVANNLQPDDLPPLQKGNFLIRQAVKGNWPLNDLVAFCEEMKASGYNPWSLHVATEASLMNENTDLSLQLLSILAEKDTVCQHYFWPLLVQYGKNNDFRGVSNTLRQMLDILGQPVSGETLKDYVMPHLKEEKAIEQLRQAGIPIATSASAMVGHLLSEFKASDAAKLALRYRSNYNSLTNRRLLVQSYVRNRDLPSLTTLVQVLSEGDEEESNAPGQILLSIIRKNKSLAGDVLNGYLNNGIRLTPEHAETIKEVLGEDATPEIVEMLAKISSETFERISPVRRSQVKKSAVEKDESSILNAIEVAKSRGLPLGGLQRQLLMYYCHNKDLEKAVALKEELEKQDLDLQPGLLILFMDLYCYHDKLEEAVEYYKRATANAQDGSRLDPSKAVRLAALLVKNDRYEEAFALLNAHPQDPEEVSDNSYGHLTTCWKLLNAIAEKGQADELKQIFDTLIRNNFVEATNVLLGPLVKVHLLKDDLESALKQFEECCVKYRATPWKNELTCKLIEKEDASSLQKVTDLSTQIHGELNSLNDLVLSFVECKKIKQARKILETPGLRTRTPRISAACTRYYNADQIDNLTTLLEATKGFKHIDRAEIFEYTLLSYCKINDVDKAFALWTQMQEEDIKPSDKFLVNLADLLRRHNRPIPFEIPEKISPLLRGDPSILVKPTADPRIKSLRKALNAKELDEALQLKSELNEEDLSKGDLSKLVSLMVINGRIGEASKMLISSLERGTRPDVTALSFVVNAIAKIGDVDSIKSVGSLLNEDFRKMVSYSNRYTHCMAEAGRASEVVEELKVAMENAKTPEEIQKVGEAFPRGGIFSIFSTAPELLPEIEKLALVYREKGYLDPTNMLWVQYTLMGDEENASKAWSLLKPDERIMFMPIIKKARQTLDLDIVEKLLEKCMTSGVNSSAIAIVYTCIIDILLSQDKLVEAEKRLEEALKVCALEDMGRSILFKLRSNLELAGKEFKYVIPPSKRLKTRRSEDSSSSSDSDNEETKERSQQRA